MMRWLALFMLLANALLLLWYALQKPVEESVQQDTKGQVKELRLVSELNPQTLVLRKLQSDSASSCVEFSGFDSEVSADAVKKFVYEQGFEAEIDRRSESVIADIALILVMPNELNARLEALEYIEARERTVIDEAELGAEYVLKGYSDAAEARRVVDKLQLLGIETRIEYEKIEKTAYLVRVFESIDRKLSNEIKEVVLESYSLQKNEKKVCEGVASLKATE